MELYLWVRLAASQGMTQRQAAAFQHIARQRSQDGGFFTDTAIKVNFMVNVGYGNPAGNFARLPRLEFGAVSVLA
ncbi:hypothetical protein FY140_24605 (plasmid) [Agrobacterium tumefaciens]|uniref:Uncharacterized protein n=1 Tax=Agrobacterium deltaense Zutra 3/1 TaxID=1183427 RepID=A0A1S7S4L6_9HYPH|nr:hypothetical protein [Agrobacterium deltaense]UXT23979.1 hypothetical protein FY140_24605 [Agrobacterium tumefaciens]CUX62438.1 hypothetical protein AGR7C_pAt0225 [Agrobacterium deltaense Zutra 3/1]